ncbi:MAG: hypothetical protein U0R19_26575 [Bryobacteraceae bacterium]
MTKWACFVLACVWLGAVQEPPPPPAAPKPKPISKEYVLTVVLVKAGDGAAVSEANVSVAYSGQAQTKPANSGSVTFRFKTDASEAVVRINAPGMVIFNKTVPLKQERIEYRAELDSSE